MEITAIAKEGKSKFKFFIDGDYGFFLTEAELRKYELLPLIKDLLADKDKISELNVALKKEVYDSLNKAVVDRGKRYALDLLSDRDYTEKSLYDKLVSVGYSESDADSVISYICEFNYLDDVRYAVNYIRSKEAVKSEKYIRNQLCIKGVSQDNILRAFDIIAEEHEDLGVSREEITSKAIRNALKKKLKPADYENQDKITKTIASLLRSGYKYSDIKQIMNEYLEKKEAY